MQCKYEVLEVVGEGAFGIVMKCRNKETNEIVAIKKFKGIEEEIVQKTMIRELKALKRLKHENIVQLKDCFKKKGQLFLAIEFLPKNLLQLLENHKDGIDQSLIMKIMFQLSKALIYMHNNDFIHRDIKPENILLSEDNANVKLCDFGLARALPQNTSSALTDYVATRWYRAPELLLGATTYGKEMDYWAMGCIMGELIDGRPLFPGDDELSQLNIIQSVIGNFPKYLLNLFYSNPRFAGYKLDSVPKPETIKRRYANLMSKNGLKFLKSLLKSDPKDRLSGNDIINHPYFSDIKGREGGSLEDDAKTNVTFTPITTTLNTEKAGITVQSGQIHQKSNIDNRFHKFKTINALKAKSPPSEMANLGLNKLNQNSNINSGIDNQTQSTNQRKKIHQQSSSIRCDINNNHPSNQQLQVTFYHQNNKNEKYNFDIDTQANRKGKKHKQHLNSPNQYYRNNNSNNSTISNPINNATQYMKNEPKPQNKLTKLFKPFHFEDQSNDNKVNFNFLPQINPTYNKNSNRRKEENSFSNYNHQ